MKTLLNSLWSRFGRPKATGAAPSERGEYAQRMEAELAFYNRVENVHDLPGIFHHWSHNHLRPKFDAVGVRGINELYVDPMAAACERGREEARFISIGAGHCDIELAIAEQLVGAGHRNFSLCCLDVNGGMLARGRQDAEKRGLAGYVTFVESDILNWRPEPNEYRVVMANQALHHFVDLEALFERIHRAIGNDGVFVTLDVIGRNGHMRWPEALDPLHELWGPMPSRYKYNHLLSRFEQLYENWDCSSEGFEGIRAQDILPLLNDRFAFEMFLGYGNLIDVFVDRAFGHNFDPGSEEDRAFIDRVAELDDRLIESGSIKPTHLVAAMRTTWDKPPIVYKHLTPQFCVRPVEAASRSAATTR